MCRVLEDSQRSIENPANERASIRALLEARGGAGFRVQVGRAIGPQAVLVEGQRRERESLGGARFGVVFGRVGAEGRAEAR